jgi:membrane associated rhomboid family serine protease
MGPHVTKSPFAMRESSSAGNGNFFPWCATALAALCVAVSLWAAGATQPLLEAAERELVAAETEWLRHPYLETGLLENRIGSERIQKARDEYEAQRIARGAPPTPPGLVRREQEALDQQLEAVLAARDELPVRRFGIDPLAPRWVSLLGHVPIHGSLAHLFGNLALLVFLGLYLESGWGRLRFVAVCASAAIGTAVGYAIASPESGRPFVGSSGLLAGLLPLFALHYVRARGDGFYWVGLVLGSLWLVLPPMAGWVWSVDAPGASLLYPSVPKHVTFGAYAGAAMCAFAAYQLLRLTGLAGFAPDTGEEVVPNAPDASRIARLRARGQLEDAFVLANTWTRREPESLDAVLTLHELAKELKREPAARTALLRAVRLEVQAGLLAAAVDHWHELADREVPREAEPALLIRLSSMLDETGDRELATRTLRTALGHAGDKARAVVAGRVARAAKDIDPQLAHDAAWRALQCTEIELEERQALEQLLAAVIPRLPNRQIDVPAAPAAPAAAPSERPAPIEIETQVRVLDVIDAVPTELDDEGIQIATSTGQKKRMRYDRIEAVSVVAVQGLAEKPVLLVDLVLDWKAPAGNKLRVIRLRADRFDPRRVVPDVKSPVDAMRQLVAVILSHSKGVALPDPDACRGMPFASFDELALYQRLVLLADGAPERPAEPPQK